jgi:UDP-2,4-diacetamido-2,4,6-trideoxy-beta-L-altropyranose hydrolase
MGASVSRLILRGDGDNALGLGHLSRLLALADMVAGDFTVEFHTRCQISPLLEAIAARGPLVRWDPAASLADEAAALSARLTPEDLVVLDGPHFDARYQAALRARCKHLVCVDDAHDQPFVADVIINHAGAVTPADYQCPPQTRFWLGPRYALLRPPFLAAAGSRQRRQNDDVLVCLGGSDPHNDLLAVLTVARDRFPQARFQIVLGAGYRFHDRLAAFLSARTLAYQLHHALSAEEMVALMRTCATAIAAPSTTSFEYASVGGHLYLHRTADNQRWIHQHLVEAGLAFDLVAPPPVQDALDRSLELQAAIFDGQSGERLRQGLRELG